MPIRSLPIVDLNTVEIDAILSIDQSAGLYPWSRQQITSFSSDRARCFFLEKQGSAIAFALCSQVMDEVSLLNIAVKNTEQGKGHGLALLRSALASYPKGVDYCFLEVRRSNSAAISLYKNLGFSQIGERANYYPCEDGREDALLMQLDFTDWRRK